MKVLFVCTGNVFRSMSAEFLLRKYLTKKGDDSFTVSSAGLIHFKPGIAPEIKEYLKELNVDVSSHIPRILSQEIVDISDVIICMAHNHKKFVKEKFGRDSYLFNELAIGESTGVKDIEDVPGLTRGTEEFTKFVSGTLHYINENIPKIYAALKAMDL